MGMCLSKYGIFFKDFGKSTYILDLLAISNSVSKSYTQQVTSDLYSVWELKDNVYMHPQRQQEHVMEI